MKKVRGGKGVMVGEEEGCCSVTPQVLFTGVAALSSSCHLLRVSKSPAESAEVVYCLVARYLILPCSYILCFYFVLGNICFVLFT